MIEELVINQLPAPTWNRLKMNETKLAGLELPQDICEPRVALEGSVCLNKSKGSNCCGCSEKAQCAVHGTDFAQIAGGVGEAISSLGEGQKLRLVADAGKSVAAVTLRYADNTSCYNQIEIEAKPGSDVTVLMTYISTAQAKGQASVQTKIDVAAGAKVKLVQVQLLGRDFLHINDVGSELGDNAAFELLQIQLGAEKIYNGARTELLGESSDFKAAIGYYGRHGQTVDMNFIANHYGSAGAIGDEKETVLLLSDDVVNQTIPLILCSEEDVQGNHGASIGKLDDELLFYLCSRGFSEQEAVDMMAKAKIDALCRKIDDEDTVQLVQRYLEGVMADGE